MLAYYISGSNNYTLRIQPTGSSNLTFYLQDMYTLVNQSSSISPYTYDSYESILYFTASIESASIGEQYRAYINDGVSSIWHGTVQVYASQSIDKPSYVNQLPVEDVYISNVTDNEYIIME